MSGKALCFWARCAIIAIAIFGICVCIFWYPLSLVAMSPLATEVYGIEFWTQLIFYWAVSLPCFAVVGIGWKVTGAIAKDMLFKEKSAKLVKIAVRILFADLAVFLIGNVIFFAIRWNFFALLYLFLAIIGFAVGVFMAILSHYLYKAAELQEESEGTI